MHFDSTREGFSRNRSANLRRGGSHDGPLEISFQSESLTDQYSRGKELENVNEFNAKVRAWGASVKEDLKTSVAGLITKDKELSKSLKNTYYNGKKRNSDPNIEIDRLGFSFRAEGVYVHLGVGRGYHRNSGVTIRNERNRSKNMRRPKEWFNPVVKARMEELGAIVHEYYADMVINSTRIFIQS